VARLKGHSPTIFIIFPYCDHLVGTVDGSQDSTQNYPTRPKLRIEDSILMDGFQVIIKTSWPNSLFEKCNYRCVAEVVFIDFEKEEVRARSITASTQDVFFVPTQISTFHQ
jgi:hypothetical protein